MTPTNIRIQGVEESENNGRFNLALLLNNAVKFEKFVARAVRKNQLRGLIVILERRIRS